MPIVAIILALLIGLSIGLLGDDGSIDSRRKACAAATHETQELPVAKVLWEDLSVYRSMQANIDAGRLPAARPSSKAQEAE